MKSTEDIEISLVVPVYWSEVTLIELYSRLVRTLEGMSLNFELIFVDDCSGDDSWTLIKGLVENDIRVRGLRLNRNYGQHNALLAGIRVAKGKFLITLDDDLQHPPEEIPSLYRAIQKGFDVVYGVPEAEKHGFFRDITSKSLKYVLYKSMGVSIAKNISAFRIFRTDLRAAFANYFISTVNIDVLLTWGTSNFGSILVEREFRKNGSSNYSLSKLILHGLSMIVGFSVLPLRVAGLMGLIFTFFGFLVFGYVSLKYLFGEIPVPGFTFIVSIISIFSGAQLLAIGVIGEYLAEVYQRSMGRPAYVCNEMIGDGV